MKFALRLLLLAFLIAAPICRAQQSSDPQSPTVRVSVDRVNVGVIVTNLQGNFVDGLTRSNFHVFDNGIEQPITDFAAIDEPAQVLLLIEAGPAVYLLEASHLQGAYGLLQGLAPSDQVALVKYAEAPELMLDFTTDKQLAASALGALHYNLGFGSLNLSASLAQTLAWLRNTQGKKSIVLLSTGIDTSPSNESRVILAQLRTGDVRLFAVSLAGGLRAPPPKDKKKPRDNSQSAAQTDQQFAEADQFLRQLAEATGGRAWFPVNVKDFRSVYAELAQLIRHEYSIAFTPQSHDGAVHTIRVTVDPASSANGSAPPSYRIDHRQAYLAPRP